jgi:hypothetical protein
VGGGVGVGGVEAVALVSGVSAPNAPHPASGAPNKSTVKVHREMEKKDAYMFMRWLGTQDGSDGDGFKAVAIENVPIPFFSSTS